MKKTLNALFCRFMIWWFPFSDEEVAHINSERAKLGLDPINHDGHQKKGING